MNVEEIDVFELQELLSSDKPPFVLDVREQHEYDFVNLEAKLIPLGQLEERLEEIDEYKDEEVIVHCRSGARSAEACRIMMAAGFSNVKNLQGGIIDWASRIDPDMPVY